MLGGWVMTRLLARRAVARVSPVIEAAAREIAMRLDLQRAVAILESAAVTVPTLIGWVRPVVLLPAAALSGLSPLQLQAILAHELAHVRRHDYLVNLLQSAVETCSSITRRSGGFRRRFVPNVRTAAMTSRSPSAAIGWCMCPRLRN